MVYCHCLLMGYRSRVCQDQREKGGELCLDGRGLMAQGRARCALPPSFPSFLASSLRYLPSLRSGGASRAPRETRDDSGAHEIGPLHRQRGAHVAGAAVRTPVPLGPAARPGAGADDPEDPVQDVQQRQDRIHVALPDM